MATTMNILAVTPFSMAFSLEGDNGVATPYDYLTGFAVPQARGPLKSLLTKLNAANALASLNTSGARNPLVRIRKVEGGSVQQTQAATDTITWTANGLTVQAAAGSLGSYEMRLAQSVER